MHKVLVSLNQITKTFAIGRNKFRLSLFDSISLEVRRGETLGVMGKSGSGKTTLGKIIAGLEFPTRGQVFFHGNDISKMKARDYCHFRHQVQMLFQDPEGALNPKKTIREIFQDSRLITGLTPKGHWRLLLNICREVGLHPDILDYFPGQISSGTHQRVALGRILMLEPELIILDEPTSALDLSIQAQILQLLKQIQRKKKISYVFISHNRELVHWMSHRIGVLEDRRFKMIPVSSLKTPRVKLKVDRDEEMA